MKIKDIKEMVQNLKENQVLQISFEKEEERYAGKEWTGADSHRTVKGILMDKATGKVQLVNGKEVTSEVTFVALSKRKRHLILIINRLKSTCCV